MKKTSLAAPPVPGLRCRRCVRSKARRYAWPQGSRLSLSACVPTCSACRRAARNSDACRARAAFFPAARPGAGTRVTAYATSVCRYRFLFFLRFR